MSFETSQITDAIGIPADFGIHGVDALLTALQTKILPADYYKIRDIVSEVEAKGWRAFRTFFPAHDAGIDWDRLMASRHQQLSGRFIKWPVANSYAKKFGNSSPARLFRWAAHLGALGELGDNQVFGAKDNLGSLYIVDVSVPQMEITTEQTQLKGSEVARPTGARTNDIVLTFVEDERYKIQNLLHQWRRIIYDPFTGLFGLPADYMTDITVSMLDKNNDISANFILRNCFPTSAPSLDLAYNTSDFVTVSQSFSVQWIDFEIAAKKAA